jgi:drug/metabolite transporter (DMT)-like permease
MNFATLFAVCVLIWGTTWYAITFQLAGTTPEVGTALRFSLAAAVLIAWCVWRRVTLRFAWPVHAWLALLGILNFSATYVLVYFAELYIVSGLVAVGYSAMPLVNMAMARVFFGTPLSRRIGLGGVCGVAGIALIFWPEFERLTTSEPLLIGAVLTAAAVLFSSLGNMIVARNHANGVDGSAALAMAMAYGALVTWILVIAHGDPIIITWTPAFVVSLIYLAVFGSVLAFGAYFALLAGIGPARSAYVGVMSTVVALFVSSIFEAYDWRWATVFGIALAILGNVLALNVKPRVPSPPPSTKPVA